MFQFCIGQIMFPYCWSAITSLSSLHNSDDKKLDSATIKKMVPNELSVESLGCHAFFKHQSCFFDNIRTRESSMAVAQIENYRVGQNMQCFLFKILIQVAQPQAFIVKASKHLLSRRPSTNERNTQVWSEMSY